MDEVDMNIDEVGIQIHQTAIEIDDIAKTLMHYNRPENRTLNTRTQPEPSILCATLCADYARASPHSSPGLHPFFSFTGYVRTMFGQVPTA